MEGIVSIQGTEKARIIREIQRRKRLMVNCREEEDNEAHRECERTLAWPLAANWQLNT